MARRQVKLTQKETSFLALVAQGATEEEAAKKTWRAGVDHIRRPTWHARKPVHDQLALIRAKVIEESYVSRQDVIDGLMDAINQAVLLEDPTAQIAGWREIIKMHGFYEPERVEHVHHHQLEDLSTKELMKLAEEDPITLSKAAYKVVETEAAIGKEE